jgi:hypothetical protein
MRGRPVGLGILRRNAMPATFQVVALSALDTDGSDTRDEPMLLYPDALTTAQELKSQGKAFRVHVDGEHTDQQIQSFLDLGALL